MLAERILTPEGWAAGWLVHNHDIDPSCPEYDDGNGGIVGGCLAPKPQRVKPSAPLAVTFADRITVERCIREGSTLQTPIYAEGWVVTIPEDLAFRYGVTPWWDANTWREAMALADAWRRVALAARVLEGAQL